MKPSLLATALLAAGLALTADAAHASYSTAVKQRTLVITGDAKSDKLALRARPRRLVVDVRDDGSADFSVARRRFDRILVRAGGGSDRVRIDESKLVFTRRTPTTLEGGRGADTLVGGRGNERLLAGSGSDVVDGNRGRDTALLGPGDDRFAWNAGDGDDAVDGADGRDALTFSGSRADEAFRLSPDGDRVRLVRDVGGVVMRLATLEQVDVNARGGADALTTDELAATTLEAVTGNLGGADTATDRVVANATNGDDTVQAAGADGGATVTGLTVPLTIAGAEPGDELRVNALAGFDIVSSALAATTLSLTADGGVDDDALTGGPAAETLLGGDGNDVVDGNQGDDRAFLGAGDDLLTWDAGDGSDAVAGEAGVDTMAFNGSGTNERFDVSANGPRVRFTRDVGNVTMDLDDVERIATEAAGGADALTAGDMSGTDVTALRIGLGTDGAADQVILNASGGGDALTASGTAGNATVTGLPNGLMLAVAGAQVPDDTLIVNTLAGGDDVNAAALAALRLTVDGGAGNDVLRGGAGPDVVLGGDGSDTVDGNQGDDVALLGAGDDTFTWDPGDGNDTIEGQDGLDALVFNGSGAPEVFEVSANGQRVRYTRNVANIVMDLDDVERIDTVALGGADAFTAYDVSGTDLTALNVALGNDGVADDVNAVASNGDDVALATGGAGTATLTGLSATLAITGAQVPADRLSVRLLAGDDVVDASGLAAGGIAFRSEGGNGDDVLIGSAGADVLRGDAGDDVLIGGPANDDLDGGAGNNTVVQD